LDRSEEARKKMSALENSILYPSSLYEGERKASEEVRERERRW